MEESGGFVAVAGTVTGNSEASCGSVRVASVYGRHVLGEWLLSYTNQDSRWLALFVGVAIVALLAVVPFLGQLVETIVLLLGFGALVLGLWENYQNRNEVTPSTRTDTEPV